MKLNIKMLKDVVFYESSEVRLAADIYLPNSKMKRPALLLIHGGAWQAGSKERLDQWGILLAEEGYVAISINYRLTTPELSTWPHVLDDVQAAYHFLLDHENEWKIDRDRIGLIGASAGAHLASLFALSPPSDANIKVVIGVYGVYDVKKWWEYTQHVRNDNPVEKLMGTTPDQSPEAYQSASPLYQISGNEHPCFFIIWGEDDEIVPCEDQSVAFVQRLKEAKVCVETLSIPGKGHFWFYTGDHEGGVDINDYPNNQVAPKILNFLNKYI